MPLFTKDYTIGLDIGTSSVKMALVKNGTPSGPVETGMKELPLFTTADNYKKSAASALGELFRGVNIARSDFILTVNCDKTYLKRVKAPYMPRNELKDAIKLEAKGYFPFAVDDAELDFEILGDVVDKGAHKYDLLVAISPKTTIRNGLEALQKFGITPKAVIPASYGLFRFASSLPSNREGVRCFVDIGSANTELIILKDGLIVFYRKLPAAGRDLTKAMTGVLISDKGKVQLSMEEAERIKKSVGLPSTDDTTLIENKITPSYALSLIRPLVENLAGEIGRCFDYYREESGDSQVRSLALSGGGACLKNLSAFLKEELGVEVSACGDKGRFGVVTGAALAGAGGINLLPPEIKEEKKIFIKRSGMEVAGVSILLISAFLYIGLKIQLANFDKRIAAAKYELSALVPQMARAEARILAYKALKDEPQWEDIFKELSHLLPDSVHIERMRMDNNVLTINGVVASETGEETLADLINVLEKGIFNNVKLVESKNLEGGTGILFEIKCWIDYENR